MFPVLPRQDRKHQTALNTKLLTLPNPEAALPNFEAELPNNEATLPTDEAASPDNESIEGCRSSILPHF
jgi:hypothetical protein